MSRGLFAGDTDYSHQSLKDMTKDLKNWIKNIKLSKTAIQKSFKEIKGFPQWKKAPQDLKIVHEKTIMMCETSIEELKNILSEIKKEIRQDHVIRLESLSSTAHEISNHYGEIWHHKYENKKYKTIEFKMIENLYGKSMDTLNDLIDLSNLSDRLEDFVGKRSGKSWDEKPFGLVFIGVIIMILGTGLLVILKLQ